MITHLERVLRLYKRLQRGPVTIEILSAWAKQAGIHVSDRQLYRDMESLKNASLIDGAVVKEFTNEKNKKTWKLEYKESIEKLTTYDINSFFLLKNFAPYSILEERKSSIAKFEKILYTQLSKNNFQQYIDANEMYLRKTMYDENKYGFQEHKHLEELIWALHNNRMVLIEKDDMEATNFEKYITAFPLMLCPMELIFHRGRVYVSGIDDQDQLQILTIHADFKFALTNEIFNRKKLLAGYTKSLQKIYGVSKPINDKVYKIKLEITKGYAISIRNFHWHASQVWKEMPNGNIMLQLECAITRELVGFVAFGLDKVKVHQPKILKDIVLKKLHDTIFVYRHNAPIDEAISNREYDYHPDNDEL